jgi:predicted Zn-dependent peptidase
MSARTLQARWIAVATVAAALGPAATGGALHAQDTTHPRLMELPESRTPRPDPDAMRLRLDNGLTAYVAEDHRAPLVTFTAFIGVGAADGAPGESHLVADALRRGPADMDPAAFRAALADMTAEYHVTMSTEETEVTLDVPAEDAERALDLFAATLRAPLFAGSASAAGSRTTQAEGIDWASSIAGAITAFEARLFTGHPYGRAPTPAEWEAARNGGAERLHATHFVPANATLAISGDFAVDEMRSRTASAFSAWREAARPELEVHPPLETSAPRAVVTAHADKLQGWVVIGHEVPRVPDEDRAALDVMDYILGAYHLDARLFRAARELRGLTNDNSSFLEPAVRGPGTYTFQTYGRPEVVRLLVDVTFRELERIREEAVTEEELFVAKGALTDGTHAKRFATGHDASRTYAREWLQYRNHDRSDRYVEEILGVTVEDVRDAARRYLHPDRMIVGVVGPLDEIRAAPSLEGEPQLEAWGDVERVDQEADGVEPATR